MKVTIESTMRVVTVNGVPARVWEGSTEAGVAVTCLVTRIAVNKADDCSQFERELAEQREPSFDGVRAFPMRLIL
jgi:hypothetical protein